MRPVPGVYVQRQCGAITDTSARPGHFSFLFPLLIVACERWAVVFASISNLGVQGSLRLLLMEYYLVWIRQYLLPLFRTETQHFG